MFELNSRLIERTDERTFFDPESIRVIKLNHVGFQLIQLFKSPISVPDFVDKGAFTGLAPADLTSFFEQCREGGVVVAI